MIRTKLVEYLVEAFDMEKNKFILQEEKVEVSATSDDVYSILGFENLGLDVEDILDEEGDDAAESIPQQFLCSRTKNLVINNLIASIVHSGDTDDDFVRKMVLVLLGTVIAPEDTKTVPKNYYALVHDVKRMRKLNMNKFTLQCLINGITEAKRGKVMKKLPKGNLALMQVNQELNL